MTGAIQTASAAEPASTRFPRDQLRAIVERIERLEEERKTISDDIRDVYAEAKGNGYDVKALRTIVRMRKQDANERAEQEAVLETYMAALGMLVGTPLGDAAMDRVGRSKDRLRESMRDSSDLAQEMAQGGLISREAADDTSRLTTSVVEKLANNPRVRKAFQALGTPVELTDEEKSKGYTAAFIGKDGTRMAIGAGA
jgi:uncharacterized protein (UPF0335 family)